MQKSFPLALFGAMSLGAPLSGQSFNIDVGPLGTGPSLSYAAAGIQGYWNSIPAVHMTPFMTGPHPNDYMLLDLNGNPTGVGLHQYGGMDSASVNDPNVSGDDAILLNDYLATHSASLESCVYLNGLQDGLYEVLTYAWMPNQPGTFQQVRFDFHPSVQMAGGAWPGQHEVGVTYARHLIQVQNGFMGFHVGIPSGGSTAIGAAWNAVQLRKLGPGELSAPAVSSRGFLMIVLGCIAAGATIFKRSNAFPSPCPQS